MPQLASVHGCRCSFESSAGALPEPLGLAALLDETHPSHPTSKMLRDGQSTGTIKKMWLETSVGHCAVV